MLQFVDSLLQKRTNSAFTESNTKNPVCYQQLSFKQIIRIRCGRPTVDFDVAD